MLYTIPKFHEEEKVSSMKSLTRGMFSDGVGTGRSAAECETPCYWTFIISVFQQIPVFIVVQNVSHRYFTFAFPSLKAPKCTLAISVWRIQSAKLSYDQR